MTKTELHRRFDEMQTQYGAPELNCIYGGGCETEPNYCFVFMNPTGKNIAAQKSWNGIRTPWLGTKNIWKLFAEIGIISPELNAEIQLKRPTDWTPEFCESVYNEITAHRAYITNLAKCTQTDARHLHNSVYREYLELFSAEINLIKPKTIILFGNTVSSIVLNKPITVGTNRRIEHTFQNIKTFTVHYPVGNGRFNLSKSTADLHHILNLG